MKLLPLSILIPLNASTTLERRAPVASGDKTTIPVNVLVEVAPSIPRESLTASPMVSSKRKAPRSDPSCDFDAEAWSSPRFEDTSAEKFAKQPSHSPETPLVLAPTTLL
jgi:hypothetical protein